MSAFLLGIGFRADMGTCVRKLVLLKLIDACEDDGSRIFPAIATVARAAQCSARQVQREIKAFLDVGLLRLVKEGGKGPRSTNEYALDLDLLGRLGREGWDALWGEANGATTGTVACDDGAGDVADDLSKKGDTVSPLDGGEKGDTGDGERVTSETDKGDKACHPTPPDPSSDPSSQSARERAAREEDDQIEEDDKGDDGRSRDAQERRFWKMARNHPMSSGMPKRSWLKEWLKLAPGEQDRAERRYPGWLELLKRQKKDHVPVLSTYFAEKLFDDVADPADEAKPGIVEASPFSRLWMAFRIKLLLAGPTAPPGALKPTSFDLKLIERNVASEDQIRRDKQARSGFPAVNHMHERAKFGQGVTVSAELAGIAETFEVVWPGTEPLGEWEAEHLRRGWPWLPEFRTDKPVFFPAGGPEEGLRAFEQALRQDETGRSQESPGQQAAE